MAFAHPKRPSTNLFKCYQIKLPYVSLSVNVRVENRISTAIIVVSMCRAGLGLVLSHYYKRQLSFAFVLEIWHSSGSGCTNRLQNKIQDSFILLIKEL